MNSSRKLNGIFAILRVAVMINVTAAVLALYQQAYAQTQIPYGDYHALVIGNNDYAHLTKLETAVNDARAMAKLLETKFGFTVTLLENAKAVDIIRAINDYRADLTPRDNLLIYYAGHGTVDNETSEGFWLPVDAESDNDTYWIENTSITRRLLGMSAKHVIVISDSCYSGTLVRDADAAPKTGQERVNWLRRMATRRSRTAMTSGANEPVADGGGGDHSVFAAALLSVLEDTNQIVEAEAVYQRLRGIVALNADQTPLYDPMRKAGHENGEFLFRPVNLPKKAEPETTPTPTPTTMPLQVEIEFWRAIAESSDPADYKIYLQQYPNGQFAPLAQQRIAKLTAPLARAVDEDADTETEEVSLDPIQSQYIALKNSNVRAKPDVRSERVTTLLRGASVQVTGKVQGRNWYAIEHNGITIGYVYSNLLQEAQAYRRDEAARRANVQVALAKPGDGKTPSMAVPAVGLFGAQWSVGDTFQECADCPEMVVVPAGQFRMGDLNASGIASEQPVRSVTFPKPFAVGVFEVTFTEWDACVADGGCTGYQPRDEGWGRGNHPVINVSWADAQSYIDWLNSKVPDTPYRLLTEAEWEYVARAGTATPYWWGHTASHQKANYGQEKCCGGAIDSRDRWQNTAPVGSFSANAFGVYDILGNVSEWVQDCWMKDYGGAEETPVARTEEGCAMRVHRGGSWFSHPQNLRAASRFGESTTYRKSDTGGFRIARTL